MDWSFFPMVADMGFWDVSHVVRDCVIGREGWTNDDVCRVIGSGMKSVCYGGAGEAVCYGEGLGRWDLRWTWEVSGVPW